MREQPGPFGETYENEIVKIAREAAEKRRVAAEKLSGELGKQQRLDGTVEPCRGYAVYSDFEGYIKQRIGMVSGWNSAERRFHIWDILDSAGWEYKRGRGRRPTRFYPPGGEEDKS